MAPEQESFDIDPSLLQDFLVESRECLEGIGELFVQLENNPEDFGLIDAIFRPVHSIKGNSSFFGLNNIKNFAHGLENLMQDLRAKTLRVNKPIIDALLRGVDTLSEMIDRLAAGDTNTTLSPEEEALLNEVNQLRKAEGAGAAALLGEAMEAIRRVRDGGPAELQGDIKKISGVLSTLMEQLSPEATEAAAEKGAIRYFAGEKDVTQAMSTIAGFINNISEKEKDDDATSEFTAALQELDTTARKAASENLIAAIESLRGDFTAIHDSGIGFDELLAELIREKLENIQNALKRKADDGEKEGTSAPKTTAAEPSDKAPPQKTASALSTAAEEGGLGKTIRVAEDTVDSFMEYVGELIIASEVFAYIQKKLESREGVRDLSVEFKKAILAFNELSFNLQRSLMAVRRVPLKNVLQKLPRTIRDLANGLGKDVNLVMEGQMVQIDKSLIEALEAPITHMVRNSVDHAIETPEERTAAGKPPQGNVLLRAEANEEVFTLTIKDDGKGLDLDTIKAKAIEKGTITESQADTMSDKEAYMLIFGAGVSTAKKVTEVSGRGVGMDVVRANIAEVNGTIDIESEVGKGTTFTITLPMTVTLLVVDGLLAQVAKTTYIIPLAQVMESIQVTREDVSSVSGKGEVVNVRGNLYPIVRLHKLFGVKPVKENPWETVMVLVQTEKDACALLVDDLIGQQSVVLKELSEYFQNLDIVRGGAILGNGRVGLVLEVEAIMEQALAPGPGNRR